MNDKKHKNDFVGFNAVEQTIRGDNPHLSWLILAAYRYSINRHLTQAMRDIERVILGNLDLLQDDFILQMIEGIESEQRGERLERERKEKYEIDYFYGVKAHIRDAQRLIKDEQDYNARLLLKHLDKAMELIPKVKVKEPVVPFTWRIADTSYLTPMKEKLIEEYRRRGHKYND